MLQNEGAVSFDRDAGGAVAMPEGIRENFGLGETRAKTR
jgi:hypothetical protein